MIRFAFRLLSLAALAGACILGVLDASRSLAARETVLTPLATSWEKGSPATFAALRSAIEGLGVPALWDPVALAVLGLPGFAILAGLALLLFAIGHKRKPRIAGRFAITD